MNQTNFVNCSTYSTQGTAEEMAASLHELDGRGRYVWMDANHRWHVTLRKPRNCPLLILVGFEGWPSTPS